MTATVSSALKFCISLRTWEAVFEDTAADVKQGVGLSTPNHSPFYPTALHKDNLFSHTWSFKSYNSAAKSTGCYYCASVTEEESEAQGFQ